jgi:hypothetical protein
MNCVPLHKRKKPCIQIRDGEKEVVFHHVWILEGVDMLQDRGLYRWFS